MIRVEERQKTMPVDLTNVVELRNVLCEEISKIRKGETTPANLNAIVNASGKIISSVKLELEYNKAVGIKTPNIDFVRNANNEQKKIKE